MSAETKPITLEGTSQSFKEGFISGYYSAKLEFLNLLDSKIDFELLRNLDKMTHKKYLTEQNENRQTN